MVNISSINHANFSRLHEITNNYNKATLLDKLIYWWQISTYTLDDDKIWFTRTISQITVDSKIAQRSVERYLHEFEQAGYIEKTNKLFKKKHLYIRITEKLLRLLGLSTLNEQIAPQDSTPLTQNKLNNHPNDSVFLNQIGGIDNANLAVSIYKVKDSNININNTVSDVSNVNNLEKPIKKTSPNKYPSYAIEQQLGERVTEAFKNHIKGTMHNLQVQHQLTFSNPEQIFVEMIFSALHTENQFPGIHDTRHRINLIAKLLRQKRWRTPKGFYNHWDIGQTYKKKQLQKDAEHHQLKQTTFTDNTKTLYAMNETKTTENHTIKVKMNPIQSSLRDIELLIASETRYLHDMEVRVLKQPNPGYEQIIQSTAIKLMKLHEEATKLQLLIEQGRAA